MLLFCRPKSPLADTGQNIGPHVREARIFLGKFRSAELATIDSQYGPNASYCPFIRCSDNCFYIYVSLLAKHTRNLINLPKVSLLLIEDETKSEQVFARERMTFQCNAALISRKSALYSKIQGIMNSKFGDVIQTIATLPDFCAFQLHPVSCSYVTGFANAYSFSGRDLDALSVVNDEDSY